MMPSVGWRLIKPWIEIEYLYDSFIYCLQRELPSHLIYRIPSRQDTPAQLFADPVDSKQCQIEPLLKINSGVNSYPIGDSGEKDPEV